MPCPLPLSSAVPTILPSSYRCPALFLCHQHQLSFFLPYEYPSSTRKLCPFLCHQQPQLSYLFTTDTLLFFSVIISPTFLPPYYGHPTLFLCHQQPRLSCLSTTDILPSSSVITGHNYPSFSLRRTCPLPLSSSAPTILPSH